VVLRFLFFLLNPMNLASQRELFSPSPNPSPQREGKLKRLSTEELCIACDYNRLQIHVTLPPKKTKEACNASLFFNSLSFLLIRLENLPVCLCRINSTNLPPWNHQQDICKFDTPLFAEGVSLLKSKITLPVKKKIQQTSKKMFQMVPYLYRNSLLNCGLSTFRVTSAFSVCQKESV